MPEPNCVVVHSLGLAFLCVQKCASTSLKHVVLDGLGEYSMRNDQDPLLGLEYVQPEAIWQYYRGYMRVAIVRDPWERLLSCYDDKVHQDSLVVRSMQKYGMRPKMSFPDFVQVVCRVPDPAADPHLRSQSFTLVSHEGTLIPDWVLRFETLANDWERFRKAASSRTGVKIPALPHLKKGRPRSSAHTIYNAAMIHNTYKRYQEDAERFGYRPPY